MRLLITMRPVNRQGFFSAEFEGEIIVKHSTRPMIEAARVLSGRGLPDDALLVARHAGADHDAMYGKLGEIVGLLKAKKLVGEGAEED